MTTRQLSLDDAWRLMVKESQHRNAKVSALAETVIDTGGFDTPLGEHP
ncbi:ANTAR domain-containing protein [Humibacillus xanthopallidus]|nr:ANTAR domain-containing protein [Humibacillus xanthopallidus]